MKQAFVILLCFMLSSCKSLPNIQPIKDVEQLVNQVKNSPHDVVAIHKQAVKTERSVKHQLRSINELLASLKIIIEHKWGKTNEEHPEQKKYVKYSNDYQARAIIDFQNSWVQVETIATKNTNTLLSQAISTTLLTSDNPDKTDIFSSKAPVLGDEPFLYEQVLDQDKKAIRYSWRANRFAQYLINTKLKKRQSEGRTITSVRFTLVDNNVQLRKQKFSEFVLASAKKYQIPASLIYGVIETESSFNPYAVSTANAYGLMQVVPATAGKDVYQKIKKKTGQPTKAVLFNPKQNIDIGSAYLSILKNNYLNKINQNQNKKYAMISAYNGGAGNVLRIFNSNRDIAFKQINQLNSARFYQILTTKHPKEESRNYLKKVTKAELKYK